MATELAPADVVEMFKGHTTSGEAPKPNFFKDHVYTAAKASGTKVPWDTGAAQPALQAVADLFQGKVLDVGCGLGENALWLASLPAVTSIAAVDFADEAIARAKARQAELGSAADKVSFIQGDVYELPFPSGEQFDTFLDSAVFHCIGDDAAQQRYLAAVTPFVKMGGRAVMLVFSDDNPDPWFGPRRTSRDHARRLWSEAGWRVDRIDDARYETTFQQPGLSILLQATRIA